MVVETGPLNRLKQTRHGPMLFNVHDTIVGRSLDLYGEFCQEEVDIFQNFICPDDVVLDIGANIGAHTLFFAKAVGPKGKVFAFEPQRLLFQLLCANMALNSVANAHCFWGGVGDSNGFLYVPPFDYSQFQNYGAVSLESQPVGERVTLINIDGLGLTRCQFIKIDVEGMEIPVVKGAALTIQRCRPVIYVENNKEEKSVELIQTLAALDYRMVWHVVYYFSPDNFNGQAEDIFHDLFETNMICIPAESSHTLTPATEDFYVRPDDTAVKFIHRISPPA